MTEASQVHDFRKPEGANGSQREHYELEQPVFLVGFMGAGKTSVSRKLARLAGVVAVDMDTFIERRCGMKVKSIFADVGEAGFRTIETDMLRELACGEARIVSCGGGVVVTPENREILKTHGFVVHLKVVADEAASRISNISTRPLFGDIENARRVEESRLPLYEEVANITVDTAGRGSGAVSREVFSKLKKAGVLRPGT